MGSENQLPDSTLSTCLVCDKPLSSDTKIAINNILGGTVFYYCKYCRSVYDTHDQLHVISMEELDNIVGIS